MKTSENERLRVFRPQELQLNGRHRSYTTNPEVPMPRINIIVSALFFMLVLLPVMHLSADDDVYTSRIIGGQEARNQEWPSTVALVKDSSGSLFQRQFCGGNVIAERWVLTAAHCVHDDNGSVIATTSFKVAEGMTDLQDVNAATETTVTNVIVHPQYSHSHPYLYNDLALLELSQNSAQPSMGVFSDNIDALTLAGESAVVVGWGAVTYSSTGELSFPTRLNQVTIPLVLRSTCNLPASYNGIINAGQICAGLPEGGKDSCGGDSGGPLMVLQNGTYKQAGIVSFGEGCGLANKYGIYTNTSFYQTWIGDYVSGVTSGPTSNSLTGESSRGDDTTGGAIDWLLLLSLLLLVAVRYQNSLRFASVQPVSHCWTGTRT